MPGARPYGFRSGDRGELLAELILSSLAFTTRVARQDDVGIDLLCVMARREGRLLAAGSAFSVQVKSPSQEFVYEKPHEIAWIKAQENPLFLCRVHPETLSVELFSTWNMLNAFLAEAAEKIVLEPGGPNDCFSRYRMEGTVQCVPLGRPILRVTASDAADEAIVSSFGAILDEWVRIDRENIVRREAGMYWVAGPLEYETNQMPALSRAEAVFWNAKNREKATANFLRTATELRLTLHKALDTDSERTDPLVKSLDSLLRSHESLVSPLAKQALRGIGLDLNPASTKSFEGG